MTSTYTYEKFKEMLANNEMSEQALKQWLDEYQGADVRLLGAKRFLENNQDIAALKKFLAFKPTLKVKQPKVVQLKYYYVAASITILIGLSAVFWGTFYSNSYYEQYATKEIGLPVYMSKNEQQMANWMNAYKAHNYKKALAIGSKLLEQQPSNDSVLFYQGIILLELNKPNDAFKLLKKVSTRHQIFTEKAMYYKALCLLDLNQLNDAKKELVLIMDNKQHAYYKPAKHLLADAFCEE